MFDSWTFIISFAGYSTLYLQLYYVVFPLNWVKLLPGAKYSTPTAYHKYYLSLTNSILMASCFLTFYIIPAFKYSGFNIQKLKTYYQSIQSISTPTNNEVWLVCLYFGYILVDSIWLAFTRCKDSFQIFHHVFTISVFMTMLLQEAHGFETTFLMTLMEISSIILNCRGIAKFYSFYKKLEPFFNLVYVGSFFVTRVLIFSVYGLFLVSSNATKWDTWIWYGGLGVVNFTFFNRALKLVKKSLKQL